MVVHPNQGQGRPGELQGLEVDGWTSCALPLDGGFLARTLGRTGGGTVVHAHGVEREAVQNLNTAVMESQSQA